MSTRVVAPVALAALAVLAAGWASPRDGGATTFNPFFAPSDFYRLSSTAPGANSDTFAQLNMMSPSSNAAPAFTSITFADSDMFIADSASIPGTGAYMGHMSMIQTMGIANEGCNSQVPVTFNFVEATTDTTARSLTNNGAMTLPFSIGAGDLTFIYNHPLDPMGVRSDGMPLNEIQIDSEQMLITGVNLVGNTYTVVRGWNGTTPAAHNAAAEIKRVNVIYPAGPYWSLYENFVQDDGDLDNNGVAEFAVGAPGSSNGNFVNDSADAVPNFVRDSLDPNRDPDDGGAQQARARYAAITRNAAHVIQLFQILVLEPGVLAVLPNLNWATAPWGYPVVTMYQDPLGPPSNDYGGSDLCDFTSNTVLFGVPHDNACTGAVTPPGPCTASDGDLIFRLAVDGGCPTTSFTNPNECGLAGQANGICPAITCPRHTNPASSRSVRFYQYLVSQRDYDNDGHANKLDTCHSDPNPNWDPRALNQLSGGDSDGDGLPALCEPNDSSAVAAESGPQCTNALDDDGDGAARVNDGCPASGDSETSGQCANAVDDDSDGLVNDGCPATGGFNDDQDADGWVNRLEACPTVPDAASGGGSGTTPNTFMWDQDVPAGLDVPDGGPNADDIAPECDIAGESCAGCPVLTPTGANGHYHATAAAQTVCIGAATSDCDSAADADGDGVVNPRDTCVGGANPPLTFPDLAPPGGAEPGSAVLTANANPNATTVTVDSASGFTQGSPIVIGSPLETVRYVVGSPTATTINVTPGLTSAHQVGDPVAQVSFAQSLRDLNNDGFTDTGDIALLTGVFGSQGGDPANDGVGDGGVPGYQGRYDLDYDGFVDTADITQLTGIFGAGCGPPP